MAPFATRSADCSETRPRPSRSKKQSRWRSAAQADSFCSAEFWRVFWLKVTSDPPQFFFSGRLILFADRNWQHVCVAKDLMSTLHLCDESPGACENEMVACSSCRLAKETCVCCLHVRPRVLHVPLRGPPSLRATPWYAPALSRTNSRTTYARPTA